MRLRFVVFTVLLFAGASCNAEHPRCAVTIRHDKVMAGGDEMVVDVYRPSGSSIYGNVLALHSAGGLLTTPTEQMDDLGQFRMACAGFIVYVPHYLEAVGLKSITNAEVAKASSSRWLADLNSFYESYFSKTSPNFLMGVSLGAYLALSLQPHVKGVRAVSIATVGYRGLEDIQLPKDIPILVQLADSDQIIPIEDGRTLVKRLEGRKCALSVVEYPSVGHNLFFERRSQASRVNVDFFSKFVGQPTGSSN